MPLLLYIPLSNQGPFPPRELPRFLSTTGFSATLTTQSSPHGLPVGTCHAIFRAFRVATSLILPACQCQYPGGNRPVIVSPTSRSVIGLPQNLEWTGFRIARFEACSAFTHMPPACSPSRTQRHFYPECLRPCRYLHDPPWLRPTGATVIEQFSHLPEKSAFSRCTIKMGYDLVQAMKTANQIKTEKFGRAQK